MILFFCGAPKNASHFQQHIITESLEQKGIPYSIEGAEIFHKHNWEAGQKLLEKLDKQNDKVFICKGHWGYPTERDILLSFKSIKIFFIWRNINDVIVSQYFYKKNKFGSLYKDFSEFFWKRDGRSFLFKILRFKNTWKNINDDRTIHIQFTELKTNFQNSAKKMTDFAGISNIDFNDLEKRVAIEALRKKHNDPHGTLYRKGKVGEHLEIISSKIIKLDIDILSRLDGVLFTIVKKINDYYIVLLRKYRILRYQKMFPGRNFLKNIYYKLRDNSINK